MASYGYDEEYSGIRKFLNPRNPIVRNGLLVVLGAVALYFLWSSISSLTGIGQDTGVIGDQWRVSCVQCNAESVVSRAAHNKKQASDPKLQPYPDCPECGAKAGCVDLTLCPKCDKGFPSDAAKAVRKSVDTGEAVDEYSFDLICPHCKHDLKGDLSHE
ncbi:MAG: hypothetical protein QGG42_01465 [Phycisphaerae bacterium]|jgi:hypothetical protein|nr:hypothetical protein [Phycisphaerae bacterium]